MNQLPAGFALDDPAFGAPSLPSGFELDQPQGAHSGLPEGFSLDQQPGMLSRAGRFDEASLWDYPGEAGKGFLEGGKNLVAGALKGYGAQAPILAERQLAALDAADEPPSDDPHERAAYRLRRGVQRNPEVREARREPLERIAATPVAEQPLYRAGHAIEEFGKEALAPRPGFEGSWTRDIGAGFGSLGAGIGISMVPGAGPGLAMTTFLGAGSGEAADRAIRAGATEGEIRQAAEYGTLAGATDMVDALLPALGSTGKALGFIRRVGTRAVYGSLAEGGQEGVQQLIQNAIARGIYKPDQDLLEEVPRNIAIGMIVGGTASGGFAAAQGRAGAQPAEQPGAAPSAPSADPPADIPAGALPADTVLPPVAQADDWIVPPDPPEVGRAMEAIQGLPQEAIDVRQAQAPTAAAAGPIAVPAPAAPAPVPPAADGLPAPGPVATPQQEVLTPPPEPVASPPTPSFQDLLDDPRSAGEIRAEMEAAREQQMRSTPLPGMTPEDAARWRDDGTIRLYRGEGGPMMGSVQDGGWYSTDPEKARLYGDVHYIDATRQDMGHFAQSAGGVDEWVALDPRTISHLKRTPLPTPGAPLDPALQVEGQSFRTAKGSTYVVHDDGTTSRNKAYRPEHGPAEQGPMRRSETTFYVDDAGADALSLFQTQGAGKAVTRTSDGRWGVQYLDGKDAGKWERRSVVQVQTDPAVGLTPVEIWKDGRAVHFGNKITELSPRRARIAPTPGTREAPVALDTPQAVHAGAEITKPDPTPAEAEAGNYRKRHLRWKGLEISVETEAGQERTGIGADGQPWSAISPAPYGYFRQTRARDGDPVDVFVGPNPESGKVYIVDQIDLQGNYDEVKVVIGASSVAEARSIYEAAFSDGSGASRSGAISERTVGWFRHWLAQGNTKRPVAYDKGSREARVRRNANLQSMGEHAEPLPQPAGGRLPQLRRPGDPGLSEVASQLSSVPGGRGGEAVASAYPRSGEHESQLRAGQRPLGDAERAGAKSAQEPAADLSRQDTNLGGMGRGVGSQVSHPASQNIYEESTGPLGTDRSNGPRASDRARAEDAPRSGDRTQTRAEDANASRADFDTHRVGDKTGRSTGQDSRAPQTGLERRGHADGAVPQSRDGAEDGEGDVSRTEPARQRLGKDAGNASVDASTAAQGRMVGGARSDRAGRPSRKTRQRLKARAQAEGYVATDAEIESAARSSVISQRDGIDELADILERAELAEVGHGEQTAAVEEIDDAAQVVVDATGTDGQARPRARQPSEDQGSAEDAAPARRDEPAGDQLIRGEEGDERAEAAGRAEIARTAEVVEREPPKPAQNIPQNIPEAPETGPSDSGNVTSRVRGAPDEVPSGLSAADNAYVFSDLGPLTFDGKDIGRQAQEYVYNRGRLTGDEYIVAIDADGKVLTNGRGVSNNVGFSPELQAAINDPKQSIVAHHNHPNNRALSTPDIAALGAPGLLAVWAHGHAGAVSRAQLTPQAKAALDGVNSVQRYRKLYEMTQTADLATRDRIRVGIRSKDVSVADANRAHSHLIATILRDAGIIEYAANIDESALIAKLNLDAYLQNGARHVAKDFFNAEAKETVQPDRRASPLRHVGDLGTSFDSPEGTPAGRRIEARDDQNRRAGNRPQAKREGPEQLRLLESDASDGNLFKTEVGADGKPQGVIPGAERITDKQRAERQAAKPLQPKKEQKDTDGLPLFNDESKQGSLFQPGDKFTEPQLAREPEDAADRQRVMQGFLARGQPIDRAIRIPFDLFGGTTPDGQWKPGKYLYEKHPQAVAGALLGARMGAAITNPIGAAAGHVVGRFVGGKMGAKAGEAVAAGIGGLPGAAVGGAIGAGAGALLMARLNPNGPFAFMNPLLESARSNLIDRYNLRNLPEYVERERGVALDKRAKLVQAQALLEDMRRSGIGIEEAAVMNAMLTDGKVGNDQLRKLTAPVRAAIDEWGQEAVRYGMVSPESFERWRGTYMHRSYRNRELEKNGVVKFVERMGSSYRKRIIGNQMKGRGIFEEVEADRLVPGAAMPQNGDKFVMVDKTTTDKNGRKRVHRTYLRPSEAIPDGAENRGTFEVRGTSNGKIVIWRDFTKAEREKMGEILDARYNFAKTAMQAAHDLSVGKFYHDIAQNEEWARKDQPDGKVIDAAEWQKHGGPYRQQNYDWVRVPDTEISDTGGKKRYGALAGMYVREEIWRDLHEIEVATNPNAVASFWRAILTQWKLNKTVRTPGTHVNNVMSNFFLMDLMDVRMQDLATGIRSYYEGDKNWQEAFENGAFGADMIAQEIRENTLKPILEDIARQLTAQPGRLGALGQMSRFTEMLWTGMKKADGWAKWAYQAEDEVFRMATYMRRRQLGDTPKEAARIAREQFIDYDIRAPLVRLARNTVLPFVSYTYRAVPLIAEGVAHRPWKVLKYALLAYAANAAVFALSGDDEDKERRVMREEEQGRTWLGSYRMTRTPFTDRNGLPLYLDVRNWVPAGNVVDFGDGDIPPWLFFGGPAVIAGEVIGNTSLFTGQQLFNRDTHSWTDRQLVRAGHVWRSAMPNLPIVPGSYSWDRIATSLRGGEDRAGRVYSVPLAVSSSVGIKLKPHDAEDAGASRAQTFDHVFRKLDDEQSRLERLHSQKRVSQTWYDHEKARIERQRNRVFERGTETFNSPSSP